MVSQTLQQAKKLSTHRGEQAIEIGKSPKSHQSMGASSKQYFGHPEADRKHNGEKVEPFNRHIDATDRHGHIQIE